MLKMGWKMGGNENAIWIKSGDRRISFDIVIPTPKGVLYAMYMKHTGGIKNEIANPSIDKMTIQQAHEKCGHCNEEMS
jgi:hypothetical protein